MPSVYIFASLRQRQHTFGGHWQGLAFPGVISISLVGTILATVGKLTAHFGPERLRSWRASGDGARHACARAWPLDHLPFAVCRCLSTDGLFVFPAVYQESVYPTRRHVCRVCSWVHISTLTHWHLSFSWPGNQWPQSEPASVRVRMRETRVEERLTVSAYRSHTLNRINLLPPIDDN